MMIQFLKIGIWNANGLCNHALELKTFLREKEIDIMMISETHFTVRSYLNVPNYVLYSTKHPDGTAHGGTAILVRRNIKHFVREKFKQEHLQATSIEIWCWGSPLTLASVYCPPKHKIKNSMFEDFFETLGQKFIAAGDFNAKHQQWGSRLANPRGRELLITMRKKSYTHISGGEPTYWPTDINKLPDLLDFCVAGGVDVGRCRVSTHLDLSSDHVPVVLELCADVPLFTGNPTLTNKRTNWREFRKHLDTEIPCLPTITTEDELEAAVIHLTEAIQTAAWNSTPAVHQRSCHAPVPVAVKDLLREKRALRKRWKDTQHPDDKKKYNKAAQNLKKLLNDVRNVSVSEYLEGLSPTGATDYSLWKAARRFNRPALPVPPIRRADGAWARSNSQKAEVFADHLSQVFQPWSNQPAQLDEVVYVENSENDVRSIRRFTLKEVVNVLCDLKPKKAPGYDLITGALLKEITPRCLRYLQRILNAVVRLGHFPRHWKVAQVIMIPKPGKKPEAVESYRPISLLPVLSKVFEKLLLLRLRPILKKRCIIPSHQFGFREGHSTIEQVHRVVQEIHTAFEEKKYCAAAFIDVSQAFDKVWHEGLIHKLRKLLPTPLSRVLQSFLTDRLFLVRQGEEQTTLREVKAGVPQGSVLGPVLFLLYTSDLPMSSSTIVATYADDTAILAKGDTPEEASHKLELSTGLVEQWSHKWRFKANEEKSVQVTFTLRKGDCPPITLNGKQIPQSSSTKYLGMHLDRRLTWKTHIFNKRKQLGIKWRNMSWLVRRKSKLSTHNKLLLYKTILKPVWSYGVQLWGTASKCNLDILQRFQNKVLRQIVDAPRYVPNYLLHKDLSVPTISEEIARLSKNYRDRLLSHPNELAGQLAMDMGDLRRLKKLKPSDLFVYF